LNNWLLNWMVNNGCQKNCYFLYLPHVAKAIARVAERVSNRGEGGILSGVTNMLKD
jgi:hypothetical protein